MTHVRIIIKMSVSKHVDCIAFQHRLGTYHCTSHAAGVGVVHDSRGAVIEPLLQTLWLLTEAVWVGQQQGRGQGGGVLRHHGVSPESKNPI